MKQASIIIRDQTIIRETGHLSTMYLHSWLALGLNLVLARHYGENIARLTSFGSVH